MVDCFDRIAVQITELALEPVRLLKQRAMLEAVSLRTPSNGRRYLITIAKRYPHGETATPGYTWLVEEIAPDGAPLPDTPRSQTPSAELAGDPEDAYWAAVDALCTMQKSGVVIPPREES